MNAIAIVVPKFTDAGVVEVVVDRLSRSRRA
jgi:hypothetical protein